MADRIHIGITGQSGFIGRHLANAVETDSRFQLVTFQRTFFDDPDALASFAAQCDAVVHLAAVSRSNDGAALYQTNMILTQKLADAALACRKPPVILLGSTVQIHKAMPYHASKRDSASLLKRVLPHSVELLMPNTFGPGSRPYWNSVVSTFCETAAKGGTPQEINPVMLELIYVKDLCRKILDIVLQKENVPESIIIPYTYKVSLTDLWDTLAAWREKSPVPEPLSPFERDLRETFSAYPITDR